jgi:hypothetical protein
MRDVLRGLPWTLLGVAALAIFALADLAAINTFGFRWVVGFLVTVMVLGIAKSVGAAISQRRCPPQCGHKERENIVSEAERVRGLVARMEHHELCPRLTNLTDKDIQNPYPVVCHRCDLEAALAAEPTPPTDVTEILREGFHLVESAFAHVSHGGPTRKDAEDWLAKAKAVLGE